MDADEVGSSTKLKIKAARSALARYRSLWKRGPLHYVRNQQFAADDNKSRMLEIIEGFPAEKIILEITEHDYVENYDDFSWPCRRCVDAASRSRSTTPAPVIPACVTSSTSGLISSSSTSA